MTARPSAPTRVRNRERVLAAAEAVFAESGLKAQIEEVAAPRRRRRRHGVPPLPDQAGAASRPCSTSMYESLLETRARGARAPRSRRRVRAVLRRAPRVPGAPPRARRADGQRARPADERAAGARRAACARSTELVTRAAGGRRDPRRHRPGRRLDAVLRRRARDRARRRSAAGAARALRARSSSTACARTDASRAPGRPLDFAQLRRMKQRRAQVTATAVRPAERTRHLDPRALGHARDRDPGGVHRRARQHGAQRRDPDDPARVPHDAAGARSGSSPATRSRSRRC